MTRTCRVCGTEFEKEDVSKEYLYNNNLCSRECQNELGKELREKRKKEGKCVKCGKKLSQDYEKKHCEYCLKKENNRTNEKYERYKEEGKCVKCGEPARENSVYCQECLDKKKKREKERREKYKREGNCSQCGKSVIEGNNLCRDCLERQNKKRERYKREGKCPVCGDELPDDGRVWNGVLCPECQEKHRNHKFHGEYATNAEIRNGLHTDMVENKLDLED